MTAMYSRAHDLLRNIDGLQPQEAFDELLKYVYFKERNELVGPALPGFQLWGAAADQRDVSIAVRVRELFAQYLADVPNDAPAALWPDRLFKSSDAAIAALHDLFGPVELTNLPIDLRSAALREFLAPSTRKGLGIFLTPENLVRAMVSIAAPKGTTRVLDPAAGSGTFLTATVEHLTSSNGGRPSLFAIERNARMLMLADLNFAGSTRATYRRLLADSLFEAPQSGLDDFREGTFDLVLTNPPFGVYLEGLERFPNRFETCIDESGQLIQKQQSEFVFIEQGLRYLRPGGRMGIVLPKSVVTNASPRALRARSALAKIGYVEAGFSLPPATFAITGAQTNAVVLFFRRYERASEHHEMRGIVWTDARGVGYDTTGRPSNDDDLCRVASDVVVALRGESPSANTRTLGPIAKGESLTRLSQLLMGTADSQAQGARRLGDLLELLRTGRTPARSAYAEESGLFILKVGNLTGQGIDWSPRDRNFVLEKERHSRDRLGLLLAPNDIVMTSSAHSPVYIGKKVDLITDIPTRVGGSATIVGELMLLRPKSEEIDPYALLAYLRTPKVLAAIQNMVRGQTAHLHPDDLAELPVPSLVLEPNARLTEIIALLKREVDLSRDINEVAASQRHLLANLELGEHQGSLN